jgi:hypothetical protein
MPRPLRFLLIALPVGLAWPAVDYVRHHRAGFLKH